MHGFGHKCCQTLNRAWPSLRARRGQGVNTNNTIISARFPSRSPAIHQRFIKIKKAQLSNAAATQDSSFHRSMADYSSSRSLNTSPVLRRRGSMQPVAILTPSGLCGGGLRESYSLNSLFTTPLQRCKTSATVSLTRTDVQRKSCPWCFEEAIRAPSRLRRDVTFIRCRSLAKLLHFLKMKKTKNTTQTSNVELFRLAHAKPVISPARLQDTLSHYAIAIIK